MAQPGALSLIVVDAAPYGVDPVVGRHVSNRIRHTARQMGYRVQSPRDTVAAAGRLRMSFPPAPADLWRVTYISGSHRGAFARVWAHEGRYVIEVVVASLDNTGPFFARGTALAGDLHQVVDRLVREALPEPRLFDEEAYRFTVASGERRTESSSRTERGIVTQSLDDQDLTPLESGEAPEADIGRRVNLAMSTESAIGTSDDAFYNHLAGMRFDYRVSRELLLGAYVGYANLRGRNGRVNNLLSYAQVEHRLRLSPRTRATLPLRFGIGYLPYNGPFIRLSAGVNLPLSDRVELGIDVLAPTFWVLSDRTAFSLNLGLELILRV
ncbi:MAG: hypothetical protein AAF654_15290 [Myxococcota bacterium]